MYNLPSYLPERLANLLFRNQNLKTIAFVAAILIWNAPLSAQCTSCTYTVGSNVGIATLSAAPPAVQTMNGGCIKVNGTFTVDAGTWSLTNVEVQMIAATSTIEVNNGCTFIATGTTALPTSFIGCNNTWSQIRVYAGATATIENCQFRNATTGVNIVGKSTFSITGNNFEDIPTCLRISGIQDQSTNPHVVSGNRFFNATTGIDIYGQNITIGNNTYSFPFVSGQPLTMTGVDINTGARNININGGNMVSQYRGVSIGTTASTRNITVKDVIFSGTTGVFALSGAGSLTVQNCTIRATENGIDIRSYGATSVTGSINVVRNTVSSLTKSAIRIDKVYTKNSVLVQSNFVRPPAQGIPPNPALNNYGIGITDVYYAFVKVDDNDIDHSSYDPNFVAPGGIYLRKCQASCIVSNNNVYAQITGNLQFGITVAESPSNQVVGNNINGASPAPQFGYNQMGRGISMESNQTDILLCCNYINQAARGLYMLGGMENCDIYNTVYAALPTALYYDQIASFTAQQFHHGNDWSSATTTNDAVYNGSLAFLPFSYYLVDPSLMPSLLNKVVVIGGNPIDWFDNPNNTEAACVNSFNSFCGDAPYEEGGFESPPGDEYLTGKDLWAAATLSDASYAVIHWDAQRYLYGKLTRNPDLLSENSQVAAFYTAAQNGNLGKFYNIETGLGQLNEESVSQAQLLADLQALNNAVSPSTSYETNEKSINALLLAALANDDWDFSASEKTTIDDVAALCPQEGGPAVYTARYLQEYYRTPDWSAECGRSEERAQQPVVSRTNDIAVFPNPATDAAQITLGKGAPAGCSLRVVNLTGQIMVIQQIAEGVTQTTLNTGKMQNGCYLVQIFAAEKLIHQQKLAIVR